MGTNYYVEFNETEEIRITLHIGLQAAGWNFMFRAHPKRNIFSVTDWVQFIEKNSLSIKDEYGRESSESDSLKFIRGFLSGPSRSMLTQPVVGKLEEWLDDLGWHFSEHTFS